MKTDILTRDDNDNIAGAHHFLVNGKLDERSVSVVMGNGLKLKGIGAESQCLAKCDFPPERIAFPGPATLLAASILLKAGVLSRRRLVYPSKNSTVIAS